jgi:hypothetical protein
MGTGCLKLPRDEPTLKLLVVGHTDNVGGFEFNRDLSQRQAASVVEALVSITCRNSGLNGSGLERQMHAANPSLRVVATPADLAVVPDVSADRRSPLDVQSCIDQRAIMALRRPVHREDAPGSGGELCCNR